MNRIIVTIVGTPRLGGEQGMIRNVGFFNTLDEAYCYAEEIIENIHKKWPDLRYYTPADGWWSADFDPDRYDSSLPLEIKVKELLEPNELSLWYAPKR